MNHERMIRNTINKYDAYPTVQQDMRKLLKYASSWQRMSLDPIIGGEPAKESKVAALIASTEDFESTPAYTPEVHADAVAVAKAITANVIMAQAGTYEAVKQELSVKYCEKPETREYLRQVAMVILSEIEALAPTDLLQLKKAAA